MRFALSNAALPAFDHAGLLPRVRQLGFAGLEVSPSLTWGDARRGPHPASVAAYRRAAEAAGLEIAGLHGLLDGRPDLGIFREPDTAQQTADYLVHLSAVCRDLGGRVLVLGAGRQLNGLPAERAWVRCHAFLERLLPRIEEHGTMLCFEPLGAAASVFCHRATDCRIMATAVDHPSFGLQLNSAALTENSESGHAIFSAIYGRLEHFAINEPRHALLGESGRVDHAAMRRHLAASGYRGWVSVQQRPSPDPLDGLTRSARFLEAVYLRSDNLSLYLRREAQAAGKTVAPSRLNPRSTPC